MFSYLSCESSQQAFPVCHCEEEMEHRANEHGDCACVWLWLPSSTISSLYVYFLSSQSGAPAARPALINQMPYWGSSILGFTSMGPWVITKHPHPRAWASLLSKVHQPSSSVSSHLWDHGHNSTNCWHYKEWVFNDTERRKTCRDR